MSTNGKVPPNDLDAESVILADCILNPVDIDKVRAILKPEDFYASGNQAIFEAICELIDTGKPVDIMTLSAKLRDTGKMQKIGGTPALVGLLDNVSATVNVETHAQRVAEKASVRFLIRVLQEKAAEAYGDVGDVSKYLSDVDNAVYNATRNKQFESTAITIGEATRVEIDNIRERSQTPDKLPGITTGFRGLDKQFGGWKRGCKYTIAARPGQGKTSLLLNHAIGAAQAGHGVIIISIEMPREQLVLRAIAQIANVDGKKLETADLTTAQWKDITMAAEKISRLPIIIVDAGSQNPATVRAAVREGRRLLKRKCGEEFEVDLIAIDYVQIMSGSGKAGHSRENEVSEVSGANRQLAKDNNAAVLELSQLSRKVEERPDKRPIMSDLRESGAIEQDSFGIIMLYRDDYYKSPEQIPDGEAELLVRKIRQGGSCGLVRVKFDGPTTNFFEDSDPYEEFSDIGTGNHGF